MLVIEGDDVAPPGECEHGIAVVKDMPGVGSHLHDHFNTYIAYKCSQPVTMNDLANSLPRRILAGMMYAFGRTGPLASMDPVGERAPFSWTPTMTSARAGSDVWPRVNTSNAAARRGAGAPGSQADKYDRLRRFTPAFTPAQAASMAAGGYARSTKQQAPPPRPPAPPPGAAGAETQPASAKVVTVDLFT